MIRFFVPGSPRTKGSARAFVRGKRAIITNDNTKEKPWAHAIGFCARQAMGDRFPFCDPVRVTLTFLLPRPQRHYDRKGNIRAACAELRPGIRPDWDKVARSAGDALTGIVYRDDALVTTAVVKKRYANQSPGVIVEVELESGE